MNRFQKVYSQGTIDVMEIWVDTETGVNYVFHRNGNASGFTPLLINSRITEGVRLRNAICTCWSAAFIRVMFSGVISR